MLEKEVRSYIEGFINLDYEKTAISLHNITRYFYNLPSELLLENYLLYFRLITSDSHFVQKVIGLDILKPDFFCKRIDGLGDAIIGYDFLKHLLMLINTTPEVLVSGLYRYEGIDFLKLTYTPPINSVVHMYKKLGNSGEVVNFKYDQIQHTFIDTFLGVNMPVNGGQDYRYDYHLPIYKIILSYTDCRVSLYSGNEGRELPYIYVLSFKNMEEHIEQGRSMFEIVPDYVMMDIQNNRALLLLNSLSEGINLSCFFFKIIQNIQREFTNGAQSNIFILDGNRSVLRQYNQFVNRRVVPNRNPLIVAKNLMYSIFQKKDKLKMLNIRTFSYFEDSTAAIYRQFYSEYNFEYRNELIQNSTTLKHFICLNRVVKDFRVILSYMIWKHRLVDKGYISQDSYDLNKVNVSSKLVYKEDYQDFHSTLPWKLDSDSFYPNFWNIYPEKQINNSFLWLVTETQFCGRESINFHFFTEKTYKPIMFFMPFIIVGNYHALKLLKEDGYQTFDRWWDESYDEEMNNNKRIQKIMAILNKIAAMSVEKIKEIYTEMRPVLEYNHRNLLSRKAGSELAEELLLKYKALK